MGDYSYFAYLLVACEGGGQLGLRTFTFLGFEGRRMSQGAVE